MKGSGIPPPWSPVPDDQRRRGERELRTLQRKFLTRTNFNLYSPIGHVYLVFAVVVTVIIYSIGIKSLLTEGIPREGLLVVTIAGVVVGTISMGLFIGVMYRKHRRIHRLLHGRCGDCGYDLTASLSEKCPECGTYLGPIHPAVLKQTEHRTK